LYFTGSFRALPSAISDVCGPPKHTAQQRQTALRHMDFLLRTQLLQVSSCYIFEARVDVVIDFLLRSAAEGQLLLWLGVYC